MEDTNQSKRSGNRPIIVLALGSLVLILSTWILLFDVEIKPSSRVLGLKNTIFPSPTPRPAPTVEALSLKVVPPKGYTVNIKWDDVGVKLVEAGAIDIEKYKQNYSNPQHQNLLKYLTEPQDRGITINSANAYFWVNTLWALGLTQKSQVLEKGIMRTGYKDKLANFASVGGWTLGAKDAVTLYSSSEIIHLTEAQQAQIDKISQGIYRPCCGNPTSFPDCNHGMATLGLIALMVSQDFSEEEIYKAVLAFNSYWFTQNYVDLAYYFQTKENTQWQDLDAKRVLSAQFSSAQGHQAIKKQIGNIPGAPVSGAKCGA